jgi:hypothetical protein
MTSINPTRSLTIRKGGHLRPGDIVRVPTGSSRMPGGVGYRRFEIVGPSRPSPESVQSDTPIVRYQGRTAELDSIDVAQPVDYIVEEMAQNQAAVPSPFDESELLERRAADAAQAVFIEEVGDSRPHMETTIRAIRAAFAVRDAAR